MAPIWQALLDQYADVVLAGHHHNYQRFAALDAAGAPAPGRGLRQFIVGTGGHSLGTPPGLSRPVEAFDNTSYGVLRLTLHDGFYEWEFVPAANSGGFRDAGRADCVQPPPAITSGPEGLIAGGNARFAFTGRSAAGFQCRLDAGSWQPCASPIDYGRLGDGEHVFAVRAASPTQTTELAAAERRFTVDATSPQVATSLHGGASLRGVIALDATPADASPVMQVRWRLDGRVIAVDDAAPWTQAWDSTGVPNGRHRLDVEASDAAGNVGRSARVPVVVGNPAPRVRARRASRSALRRVLARGLALDVRCSRPCRLSGALELARPTAAAPRRRPADRRGRRPAPHRPAQPLPPQGAPGGAPPPGGAAATGGHREADRH